MTGSIPTRQFGRHDEQVSLLAVGGAHLATPKCSEETAIRIVHECIDAGATFMATPGNITTANRSGAWARRWRRTAIAKRSS